MHEGGEQMLDYLGMLRVCRYSEIYSSAVLDQLKSFVGIVQRNRNED